MPQRGLRKPASRRSLRPRNHNASPRTAAEAGNDELSGRASSEWPDGLPRGSRPALRLDSEGPRVSGYAPAGTGENAAPEHHEQDGLAHAFFEEPQRPSDDDLDDHYVIPTLSRGSRRAMYASLGIFTVSVLAIGGYSFYQNAIMPSPVELGATAGEIPAILPTPVAPPAPEPAHFRGARLAEPPKPAPAEPAQETQLSAATTLPALEVPRLHAAPPAAKLDAPAAKPTPDSAPAPDLAKLETPAAKFEAPAEPVPGNLNATPIAAVPGAETPVGQAPDAPPGSERSASAAAPRAGAPTYDELVAVGRAFSKKNRRVEASEAFRRALLQSPQGSAALSGLSFVYLNADEKQHAREYAQRAVQADASNAEGWIVLGAALELLGDRAGARDAYRNCVERGQGPYLSECRRVAR